MTSRLLRVDRVITFLVGATLIVLGLLVLDWRYREVFTNYQDTLSTSTTMDLLTSRWFPWAFAIVGVILGLLGLYCLLTHLRREGPATLRLRATDHTGRVQVDLSSVAGAAAQHLGALAPITGLKGTTKVYRSHTVVELRGHVDPAADVTTLSEAVTACAADVEAAFPNDDVTCRIVLDAPRRHRPGRDNRIRVH